MTVDPESVNLEDLVATHLTGETQDVPESKRVEFNQAVAGHHAMQAMIEETIQRVDIESDERLPPDLPDDYQIKHVIGKGGMGVVYLAHQQSLHRDVALKVLRPGEQTFGPLVRRFLGEAKHLAKLRHPNIVSIHEIGDAQGEPYFTMDYIDGESLSATIRRGAMSPTQALAIFKQVAEAVQHAHRQGIIHRDLKPANVLIDDRGTAFVTDFGIARDVSQSSDLTQTGELLGTPQYMSPEQARGQSSLIGEATDVHALGLLLFEMLTGRAAFASSSPAEVLVRLLNDEAAPLRTLDRRIPRDLETICQKMLQKNAAARYPGVSALLEDTRRFEAGEPLVARRSGAVVRTVRVLRKHWKIATAVTVTAALMLIGTATMGPRLFDKTDQELLAWAEECREDGRYQEAVDVYQRVLNTPGATPRHDILRSMVECCEECREDGRYQEAVDIYQLVLNTPGATPRHDILRSMVECCVEIGDSDEMLAAALPILEKDPDVSFGEHDYLIARAVYSDLTERIPRLSSPSVDLSQDDRQSLQRCARRFELFLDGTQGTVEERRAATDQLQAIQKFLYQRQALKDSVNRKARTSSPRAMQYNELPQGPPNELLKMSEDGSKKIIWIRGLAAYAAGLALEKSEDHAEALKAYHTATNLMRSVFPIYAGLRNKLQFNAYGPNKYTEDTECGLLRQAYAAVQRLDPNAPDQLQGGIRFRRAGMPIPAEMRIDLRVELRDPSVHEPGSGHSHLPTRVRMQDGSWWIGIANGRYRLRVSAGARVYPSSLPDQSKLLEPDFSKIPREVEVSGDVLEFEVPFKLIDGIEFVAPADNARVDLRTEVFHWSAVENADHYRIQFLQIEERAGAGSYLSGGGQIHARTNRLCIGVLTDDTPQPHPTDELRRVRRMQRGLTYVWGPVQAFDADGRLIGRSVDSSRQFLVTHGVEDPETN